MLSMGIWDKKPELVFEDMTKLLKPTKVNYPKFSENNMQLVVNYTLNEMILN